MREPSCRALLALSPPLSRYRLACLAAHCARRASSLAWMDASTVGSCCCWGVFNTRVDLRGQRGLLAASGLGAPLRALHRSCEARITGIAEYRNAGSLGLGSGLMRRTRAVQNGLDAGLLLGVRPALVHQLPGGAQQRAHETASRRNDGSVRDACAAGREVPGAEELVCAEAVPTAPAPSVATATANSTR